MDNDKHEALLGYVRDLFATEDDHLKRIRAVTQDEGMPSISLRAEEGQLLGFLIAAVGARRVLEIGMLAGYSATWILRALPPDGHLDAVEADAHHAEVAERLFEEGGFGDRVLIHIGTAEQALPHLEDEVYDAVFIDANRPNYPDYLGWALDHLRVGGLVAAHNAFFRGRVIDPDQADDAGTAGVVALNRALAENPRWHGTIIPLGDGLAAGVKRA